MRRFVAALLVASVALGFLAVPPESRASPWTCGDVSYASDPLSQVIQDGGFEADLTFWYTATGGGGANSPTISTTTVHTGAKSARVDASSSPATHAEQDGAFSSSSTVFSFSFYPETWGPGGVFVSEFMRNWTPTAGTAEVVTAVVLYPTSVHWTVWKSFGGPSVEQDIPVPLAVGSWYTFDVVMDRALGIQCLFLDGAPLASASLNPADAFDADVVLFGDASFSGDAGVAYYDDESLLAVEPVLPDYAPANPAPAGTILIGESLPVSLSVEVWNRANVSASNTSATTLAFYNESTPSAPFMTFSVPPLAAQSFAGPFSVTWRSPSVPGTYRVVADVDYSGDLIESDELNNLQTWTIGVLPPPYSILSVGDPNYAGPTATYVTFATPLTLIAFDASGTGIRRVEYRDDGGPWSVYATPFALAGDGSHLLEWFSEDNVGNVEPVRSARLSVDDTPPTTTLLVPPGPWSYASRFELAATDAGSGVARTEYRVDGGPWREYEGSFSLAVGNHEIRYRSVDRLGNQEPESVTFVRIENWKPFVAFVFALVLALVGAYVARRPPRDASPRAQWRHYAIYSIPFVAAEAATGVVSLITGALAIPPYLDLGTVVDVVLFAIGIIVALVLGRRARQAVPRPAGWP